MFLFVLFTSFVYSKTDYIYMQIQYVMSSHSSTMLPTSHHVGFIFMVLFKDVCLLAGLHSVSRGPMGFLGTFHLKGSTWAGS